MESITKGQKALIINSYRYCNHPEDIKRTMTVGDLIGLLEWYDPETPIIVRGYDEYQFNPVDEDTIQEEVI